MEVFRLTRLKYKDQLSGIGASLFGQRWNSKGVKLIYSASNRSLAMAEVSVHLTLEDLPKDYFMLTIYIPDNIAIKSINQVDLPKGWHSYPAINSTQLVGDQFIQENQFTCLKVPSSVTQGDYNILINENHKDFNRIQIIDSQPFPFDRRLIRAL